MIGTMPDAPTPPTPPPPRRPSLFAGRGVLGHVAWGLTLVLAGATTLHAARTGAGRGVAVFAVAMAAAYTLMPWLNAARDRADVKRRRQLDGTLTIDDWGVTRTTGSVREAIAWDDLAWVRIYTTSDGPGGEDFYFALGARDGKGCLVPNSLAVATDLLAALQARLPDLDNEAVVRAAGSTTEAWFRVWPRTPD